MSDDDLLRMDGTNNKMSDDDLLRMDGTSLSNRANKYELTDEVTQLTFEDALYLLQSLARKLVPDKLDYEFPNLKSTDNNVFSPSTRRIVRQVNMLKNKRNSTLREENRYFLRQLTKQLIANLKDLKAKKSTVPMYIRSLYYCLNNQFSENRKLTITPNKVSDYIDRICCYLKCDRESLGVMACDTSSSYVRNIVIVRQDISGVDRKTIEEDGTDLTHPYRINYSTIKSIRASTIPPRFILIVEKMTLLTALLSSGIPHQTPCVIITGSGQPSIECRLFVKRVHKSLENVPIFALVDCNPFGVDIFKTYKYGSMNLAFMSRNLVVASIRFLGLCFSDITDFGVKVSDLMKLEVSDSNRLRNLLKEEWLKHEPEILASLNASMRTKRKADVEILAMKMGSTVFMDKVMQKIISILES